MQGEENQAEPDGDAAERLGETCTANAERHQADDEQYRSDRCDVERQKLYDQGGADIGAQHDGECRHQADHTVGGQRSRHQASRGARLQQRGEAKPGGEGGKTVAQRGGQKAA